MRKFFVLFFKVQCFPCFHDTTRSRVGSSVPLLNENSQSEHDYEFEHFSGHKFTFKMLIDYTLDLTPPLLPLPPIPPSKEREDEETALKFPLLLAHVVIANTPIKFFSLHLGTNFLSFDWDLLAFSFSNLFLNPPPPPPPFLGCSS